MSKKDSAIGHDPLAWLMGAEEPEDAHILEEHDVRSEKQNTAPEPAAAPEPEPAEETSMNSETESSATSSSFKLDSDLTVEFVAELKEKLLATLGDGNALTVNAEEVGRADAAGVQIMAATQALLKSRSGSLSWENVSPELAETADLLGAKELIGM